MNLQDLYEGRQDNVMKLIQRELWPIAKRLERTLKSGQVITMRDNDGSVLRDCQAKAIEIVQQYKGAHAESHLRVINDAHDYKEVIKILTNVLLSNDGNAVVR